MSSWQATHVVPSAGIWVWDTPDADTLPTYDLQSGVPVQIVETHNAWSRVVCDNGFSGWVDNRQLIAIDRTARMPVVGSALTPPPSPARRRRSWTAVAVALAAVLAVVAVVAVAAAVLLTGRSGDDDVGGPSGSSTVALHVPRNWARSSNGLAAAETEADLARASPQGPTVRALVVPAEGGSFDQVTRLTADFADDDCVVEDPVEGNVDGFKAVTIRAHSSARVEVLIAVRPPSGFAFLFRVDAPADRFPDLQNMLEGIPGIGFR
jgi:hypothetical protein